MSVGKRAAVRRAVREVRDGWVVAVGSGSTVALFLEELSRLVLESGMEVTIIPGSSQSYLKAVEVGLRIGTLDEYPEPDADFDGADEVSREGYLLKGGGAALTREKVLASYSRRFFVVVDESKLVEKLGLKPVPIEVLPFALTPVLRRLSEFGEPLLREAGRYKNGPVVTDNGNYIVDLRCGPIDDPAWLEARINEVVGVVENGIFTIRPDAIFVGKAEGTAYVLKP